MLIYEESIFTDMRPLAGKKLSGNDFGASAIVAIPLAQFPRSILLQATVIPLVLLFDSSVVNVVTLVSAAMVFQLDIFLAEPAGR